MTQDPEKQDLGTEPTESEPDVRHRQDRALAAYQFLASMLRELTPESKATLDALKQEAGLVNQALSPGFSAILERAGLGHQLPPVVVSAPMTVLNIPTRPFGDAIQPVPVIDWSTLDANEAAHGPGEMPSVASVLFRGKKTHESVPERNARWLQVHDAKALQMRHGAQAAAAREIAQIEGVKRDTVKRGLQDAQKARDDRSLSDSSGTIKVHKNRPATPFDGLMTKGKCSR